MPSPYSQDLRSKVLELYDSNAMSIKTICSLFKIDVKTLYYWRKRRDSTGSIQASSGYQKGHSHKIKDMEVFIKFVQDNQGITVDSIIDKFGNMCKNTVYNYLKKIGYTYKKKPFFIKKEMNQNANVF